MVFIRTAFGAKLLGTHFVGLIQDDQDRADHEPGGDHADHHGQLLFPGVPPTRYPSSDLEMSPATARAVQTGHRQGATMPSIHSCRRSKQEGDDQDGGDRHAETGRGTSDDPDDAGGDGHEQKTEDGDGQGAEMPTLVTGAKANDDDDQYAQSHPLQGDV